MGGRCGAACGDVTRSSSSGRSGSPGYLFDGPGGGSGIADADAVPILDTDTVPADYWHHNDHSARSARGRLPPGTGSASARRRTSCDRWRIVPAQAQNPSLILRLRLRRRRYGNTFRIDIRRRESLLAEAVFNRGSVSSWKKTVSSTEIVPSWREFSSRR
jgi:hypothetical protein